MTDDAYFRDKAARAAPILLARDSRASSIGEGPFHVLKNNMVQIYVMPIQVEIKDAIRLLNENGLERMTMPLKEPETDQE